ncbi:transient receptor potential cation channel subfamily M member-like 2, partial [Convolutriloba macropyga]|uniref:transient receptor potential cation channel subfamily M member-like 2 n=1 Tax=Convolutriloba macropyga TaxID=536237 RepID=UPI003F5267F2
MLPMRRSQVQPQNPVPVNEPPPPAPFEWIRQNIKFSVCICYKEIPSLRPAIKSGSNRLPRAELETEKRCQCGYLKEEHDPQALNRRHRDSRSTLPWNFYDDTEKRPTDAYGVAVFPPGMNEMNRNGPYVRITPDTSYKDIVTLFKEVWRANYPQMVLSVWGTDTADGITLPERSFQTLRQAIMRIAAQSGSWVVTKGLSTGVSQVIGQGFAEYYSDGRASLDAGDPISSGGSMFPLIGVCTYGMLANMSELEQACDENRPARLNPMQANPDAEATDGSQDLDPNHRFFLLVDNGTFRKPDQDTELRLKLMDAISKYSPSRDEDFNLRLGEGKRSDRRLDFNTRRVPVLNLIVGGNLSVFTSISMSLQYKMPCLLVRNSGGVADFLDAIMRKLP